MLSFRPPTLPVDVAPRLVSPLHDFLRDPVGVVHTVLDALQHELMSWGPVAAPTGVATISAVLLARPWWRRRCHARMATDARVVTVLAPPTVDPNGPATLYANLVGLLRPGWARRLSGQPHIAWEYVFSATGLALQVWVPGIVPPGMIERAIEAAWPGAHTHTVPATPPIPLTPPRGTMLATVGGELRLARSEALPLRSEFPTDPARALLGAPTGLGAHERAVVQILARPVTGSRVRRARRAGQRVRAGGSVHIPGRLLDLLTPHATGPRAPAARPAIDYQTSLAFNAQDRAIVTKQHAAHYEARIRYAVATALPTNATAAERSAIREHLRGRGHAIASAFASYTEHNYLRRVRLRQPLRGVNERRLNCGDLLSIPELSALAHVPLDDAVPGLQRAGARSVPPPPGVPTDGPEIKPIGVTDSGYSRPVGLRAADARHHIHILGATGSGKSELMARMVLADVNAGRGVVVIDPKGDLVTDILTRLPAHVGQRVALFDADNPARPPVLNPLEGDDTGRTVDNLVSTFSRVYSSSWGPRTEDLLRSALLTLRATPGTATLADLPKLLTVPSFRERALDQINDDILCGFWQWYDELSAPARAQVTAPLMNKVRGLLLRPFVHAALARGASTISMDAILDGGICLARISKGALGTDTARLVGSIIVAHAWQAATHRARLPQRDRLDCSIYVDECHNFLNLAHPIEDMLAEARAHRMSIVLAHQHLRQLPRELAEGISSNARSKIIFSASPEDARDLARHTHPQLSEHDLSHLGAFHIAARLVVAGAETAPFTARTEKLQPAIRGRARQIRTLAAINTQPLSSDPSRSASPLGENPAAAQRPAVDPRRAAA